jgi:hypothetical protein
VSVFFFLTPNAMPEQTPKTNIVSRTLGISLGVTEWIFLLGLVLLATGMSLAIGIDWALMVVGLFLIRTAENNARERQ